MTSGCGWVSINQYIRPGWTAAVCSANETRLRFFKTAINCTQTGPHCDACHCGLVVQESGTRQVLTAVGRLSTSQLSSGTISPADSRLAHRTRRDSVVVWPDTVHDSCWWHCSQIITVFTIIIIHSDSDCLNTKHNSVVHYCVLIS